MTLTSLKIPTDSTTARTTTKKNYRNRIALEKLKFKRQYPNADVNKFSFNIILSKTGHVTGTNVSYKIRKDQYLDITTDLFQKTYSSELYWKPRIWDIGGTVQPFTKNSSDLKVNSFKIYVTDDTFFDVVFHSLK